jgi:hypothetical protein
MGNKINGVLGLNPSTRKRTATHSKLIRSSEQCPYCHAYRVIEAVICRIRERSCQNCFKRWRPDGEPAHVYIDGVGAWRCRDCFLLHPTHLKDCKFATA